MNKYLKYLSPLLDKMKRYTVIIVFVVIGGVYGYLIFRSSQLAEVQPSQTKINEEYQGAKRPKIDQVIVDKLNELEDNNVPFQALIDEARQNPFSE